jgi:hypothetical protein
MEINFEKKQKKKHTAETIPKPYRKILETEAMISISDIIVKILLKQYFV